MTDKASPTSPQGYVVRVQVPYIGGGIETTLFYSRIADRQRACAEARAEAGVGPDAQAEIVAPLHEGEIAQLEECFSLGDGETMHWVRI